MIDGRSYTKATLIVVTVVPAEQQVFSEKRQRVSMHVVRLKGTAVGRARLGYMASRLRRP
jgi:hypothetical protein